MKTGIVLIGTPLCRVHTLGADVLAEAGATWEWLSGWLPGGMDAEAWEAVIPSMGYMAMLRNLRNFDQARHLRPRREARQGVLANADAVAQSRQFPYRFWSAQAALERGLNDARAAESTKQSSDRNP